MISPFSPEILLAIPLSLVLFYLLGIFITPKVSSPLGSLSLRLIMGALLFTVCNAVIHTGTDTMLVVFLILFPVLFTLREKRMFWDIASVDRKHIIALLCILVGIIASESIRSDVRLGSQVYIGNSDVSFYSSLGHFLYLNGQENLSVNIYDGSSDLFYHYSDLWFSGFYSKYLGVMPYYAYNIIYRSVFVFLFFSLIYGWSLRLNKSLLLGLATSAFAITVVNVNFYHIDSETISLFKTFITYTPVYGASPYLFPGVVYLASMLIIAEGHAFAGTLGIVLVSALNPALAVALPGSIAFIILVSVLSGMLKWKNPIPINLGKLVLLLLASVCTYLYSKIDGRMEEVPEHLKSIEYLYLILHTLIRYLISSVYIMPFFVGIYYFAKNEKTKYLFWVSLSVYLGVMASFAIIFPWLQGNSIQIMSLHFSAMFGPIAALGLAHFLVMKGKSLYTKILVFSMALIAVGSSINMMISSNLYERLYDWSETEGYVESSTLDSTSYSLISRHLANHGNRVGYYVVNEERYNGGSVRYNEFTNFIGAFPGLCFYRLNPIEKDTVCSLDMRNWYNRTALAHFSTEYTGKSIVNQNMLQHIDPGSIVTLANDPAYGVPEELQKIYTEEIKIGQFTFYSVPKTD